MKILQLLCFPLYGSGSGVYVRKLSESLVANGHEVAIVTPDSRKLKKIKVYEVKLPFMAAFTGHPEHSNAKLYSKLTGAELNNIQNAFQKKIIQVVERFKPDVIHVHHASNLSWIANYIKATYQIHYIVTSHNTDIINSVLDKRFIPLTQDALNRADVIVAVSDNTKERLLKIIGKGYPSFKNKTKVIPCGVDINIFPNVGSTSEVDKRFNIKNQKVALYSGKLTSIKGIDLFVKAAKKFPNAAFVIIGGGGEIKQIKEIIKKDNIINIIFTGYLGNKEHRILTQLYRRADVVAIPSTLSEGVPLTALEGMSSGSVVVASNIGGIPTLVKHMRNGVLIKPGSVNSLIEGIRTVFENPDLQKSLSSQARKDIEANYSWDTIAQRMERYYQIPYKRSIKNRSTKKPSFVTMEEYTEIKELTSIHQEAMKKDKDDSKQPA